MVEQLCLNGFTLYKYICNKKKFNVGPVGAISVNVDVLPSRWLMNNQPPKLLVLR